MMPLVVVLVALIPIGLYFWREHKLSTPSLQWPVLAKILSLQYEANPPRMSGLYEGRRVAVEAAPGGAAELLAGEAAADRWVLEPGSGRAREYVAGAAGRAPVLSPARLKALARLARALDAWRGGAVEAAFSYDGDKLYVHHARALEPPRPVQPLSDPFTPRPAPEALNVKSVR